MSAKFREIPEGVKKHVEGIDMLENKFGVVHIREIADTSDEPTWILYPKDKDPVPGISVRYSNAFRVIIDNPHVSAEKINELGQKALELDRTLSKRQSLPEILKISESLLTQLKRTFLNSKESRQMINQLGVFVEQVKLSLAQAEKDSIKLYEYFVENKVRSAEKMF